MNKWKVSHARVDSTELEEFLKKGWEPFAVSNQGIKIWLRKQVISKGK